MEMSGSVLPLPTTTPTGAAAVATAAVGGAVAAAPAPPAGAAGSDRPATGVMPPPQVSSDEVERAVARLNQRLAQSSGVQLTAGLDVTGEHPGRVLIQLSDRQTQQVYFKYYVPAEQLLAAADGSDGAEAVKTPAPAGTLLRARA